MSDNATKEKSTKARSASKKTSAKGGETVRMRIKLKAYENKILDASVKQIMDTAFRHPPCQLCSRKQRFVEHPLALQEEYVHESVA